MKLSTGYIVATNKAEAKEIAEVLLEEELISCANIIPSIDSYFIWEGEIQKAKEIAIIIKTKQKNEEKIIKIVKQIHQYKVPCVTFSSIEYGNMDFLKWINKNC